MKINLIKILVLITLSAGITSCGIRGAMFANSPYGVEAMSLIMVCAKMYEDGKLPMINVDENKQLEFKSGGVQFSNRNIVTYPLELTCIAVQNDKEQTFAFVKQSQDSTWVLEK